jgi:hypothetical protein
MDGAAFGPNAFRAIGEAFDAAWAEIADNFANAPVDVDNARYRLANALLSVAVEDSRDVEVLKRAALQRMALDYPRRGEPLATITPREIFLSTIAGGLRAVVL